MFQVGETRFRRQLGLGLCGFSSFFFFLEQLHILGSWFSHYTIKRNILRSTSESARDGVKAGRDSGHFWKSSVNVLSLLMTLIIIVAVHCSGNHLFGTYCVQTSCPRSWRREWGWNCLLAEFMVFSFRLVLPEQNHSSVPGTLQ